MTRPLVLASTSRYRKELLERLGVPFEAVAPALDEEAEKARAGPLAPADLARHLARKKAESLAGARPDALILGSDQIADLDGERLDKPGTEERARAQLARLAGRTHRVITAVAVHDAATGRTEDALDVHEVTLRPLTDEQIRAYVARDRPLDCCGSYRVESLGIALMERLRGDDFTAIVGLPLTRVVELLSRFGDVVL